MLSTLVSMWPMFASVAAVIALVLLLGR